MVLSLPTKNSSLIHLAQGFGLHGHFTFPKTLNFVDLIQGNCPSFSSCVIWQTPHKSDNAGVFLCLLTECHSCSAGKEVMSLYHKSPCQNLFRIHPPRSHAVRNTGVYLVSLPLGRGLSCTGAVRRGLLFHVSVAINADVTHSKRSPGIDKANKLTYHLSTTYAEMEGRGKGRRLHLVIMNPESIPVGCIAGTMIAVYLLYMP